MFFCVYDQQTNKVVEGKTFATKTDAKKFRNKLNGPEPKVEAEEENGDIPKKQKRYVVSRAKSHWRGKSRTRDITV